MNIFFDEFWGVEEKRRKEQEKIRKAKEKERKAREKIGAKLEKEILAKPNKIEKRMVRNLSDKIK